MAEALCSQTDPEIFFPEKGGETMTAVQVCRRCPVQATCLQWAIDNNETYGVWGGMSYRSRIQLQQDRTSGETWHGTNAGYRRHLRYGQEPCDPCREAYNTYYRNRYQGKAT